MKSKLNLLLTFLLTTYCYSQNENDKIVYLDSNFLETKSSDYKFYRIIKDYQLEKDSYTILDYYKSGVLQMEGKSLKKDLVLRDGEFLFYYENGNKKNSMFYLNGKPIGIHLSYYENGNLKEEGEYTVNQKDAFKSYKINQYWNENKQHLIIDGNGAYSCGNEDYTETGTYKDGYKDGVFEGKNSKQSTSYSEKYENGKFISGTRIFADNTTKDYSEMEKKPEPKNGYTDFYKFIGTNYRIPNMPKGIKGKVYITFVVEKDGTIVEPRVLKDLGYGTGEEAIRVVSSYNGFSPGEQRGQKVRCSFSLPISIQSSN